MKPKIILYVAISVFLIFILIIVFLIGRDYKVAIINNFEECAAAGYPILESYPEQCKTPDGRTFVRIIAPKEAFFNSEVVFQVSESITFPDGLSVTLLKIDDSRCKPEVVCFWAGELSPVFTAAYGNIKVAQQEIRLGEVTAKQLIDSGYIFSLNNATETSATITIDKQNNQTACYVGGCSGQICSDKEGVVSDCMYRKEYACYKNAKCVRQSNNQCAWTQTEELQACLNDI